MRRTTPALALPAIVLLALGAAACGGEAVPVTQSTSNSGTVTQAPSTTDASPAETSGGGVTSSKPAQSAPTSGASADTSTDTISAMDLQVGDCFTDMGSSTGTDNTTISTVDLIDCNAPHLYEVYADGTISSDTFPDTTAMQDEFTNICYDSFTAYVGVEYSSSIYSVTDLEPTEASWADGDRVISCVLTSSDGSNLTGSAKGTNQ